MMQGSLVIIVGKHSTIKALYVILRDRYFLYSSIASNGGFEQRKRMQ